MLPAKCQSPCKAPHPPLSAYMPAVLSRHSCASIMGTPCLLAGLPNSTSYKAHRHHEPKRYPDTTGNRRPTPVCSCHCNCTPSPCHRPHGLQCSPNSRLVGKRMASLRCVVPAVAVQQAAGQNSKAETRAITTTETCTYVSATANSLLVHARCEPAPAWPYPSRFCRNAKQAESLAYIMPGCTSQAFPYCLPPARVLDNRPAHRVDPVLLLLHRASLHMSQR